MTARLRGPERLAAAQDRADRRGDGGDRRHHGSDSKPVVRWVNECLKESPA
jgi:hypothetical protein